MCLCCVVDGCVGVGYGISVGVVGGVCDVGGVGVVMRHFDSVSLVFVMLFSFVVIGFVLPSLVLMIALVLLMCSSILLIML